MKKVALPAEGSIDSYIQGTCSCIISKIEKLKSRYLRKSRFLCFSWYSRNPLELKSDSFYLSILDDIGCLEKVVYELESDPRFTKETWFSYLTLRNQIDVKLEEAKKDIHSLEPTKWDTTSLFVLIGISIALLFVLIIAISIGSRFSGISFFQYRK